MKLAITLLMTVMVMSCTMKEKPDSIPVKTGKEGTAIPSLNLLLAQDSTAFINTASIANGETTLFFYFSPVCPHCRVQTRRLINDMDRFKDIHIVFLTIADYKLTKSFYDRYGLDKYPNITTGIDTGYVFPQYFKTQGVPFFAIYQGNKKLDQAFMGEIPMEQLYRVTHNVKDIAQKNNKN